MARTLAKCALPCSGKDGTAAWFTVKYRRMCGICGVIGIERSELGEATTRRMMEALWHRGPDEDGLLVAPSAALGMRRLSIIDLPGGAQPIFNESGDVGIVFNGEIYNFRQLRKTLEGRGHTFRTNSDTETIVHAYEEWGRTMRARTPRHVCFCHMGCPLFRNEGGSLHGTPAYSSPATGWASSRCTMPTRMARFFLPPKSAR